MRTINVTGFDIFIEDLVEGVEEGLIPSQGIRVVGSHIGFKARMTHFDIVTQECGKIYLAKGLFGMIAIVTELVQDGRKIRSVKPTGMFARNIEGAEFTLDLLDAPIVENPHLPGDYKEKLEGMDEVIIDEELSENTEQNTIETDTKTDIATIKEVLTKDELQKLTKPKILIILKENGLKGNIQESKKVLIERSLSV